MRILGRRPGWCGAVLMACGAMLVVGCGGEAEKLAPVVGKVTVNGKPLKSGTVSFRPEQASKSQHQPNGTIDAEGNYEMTVPPDKKGVPPGWYKVVVVALDDPWPGKPLKSFVDMKYADEKTTPLKLEVVANPEPGRYDLKLTK
jgi:hypothetical protein